VTNANSLETRWIGGLPIVNDILHRLQFGRLLREAIPHRDHEVEADVALGVLLRNIVINDRQPIYTLAEWAARIEPELLGLGKHGAERLNDDRMGRALERLFDADRSSLLTKIILQAIREFMIDTDHLHNDSTTLTLTGAYKTADGHVVRGQPTLKVTYGHNKDHRHDLKQLLFVLTVSGDGAVPIHYRSMDGNTSDSTTHIDTWETLKKLAGRADFLYIADSKLCSKSAMAHIDKQGGRFVTVLPKTRREDRWFREQIQKQEPRWEEVIRRPNRRRQTGPEDVWKATEAALPSAEGYRIVWVSNSLMALKDASSRGARIEKAFTEIGLLQEKLQGPRCRLRLPEKVDETVRKILKASSAERWVRVEIQQRTEAVYRQAKRGRPGPKTPYVRKERLRFSVHAHSKTEVIAADASSDGMFPLITNCKDLSLKAILEAYKDQPRLEKRHEQLKSVQHLAPVWLKKPERIEALLFLYFVALLVHALLERELRREMEVRGIKNLPLYPEDRECKAPSTERTLELFAPLQRHRLRNDRKLVQIFEPELSDLQKQILSLMNLSQDLFKSA